MKKILPLLIILFSLNAVAKDFEFGNVTASEMSMKKYAKDTSAHAVVLSEYGESKINVGSDDYVKLYFLYHVKIKIFDKNAFDQGKVEIPLYRNDEHLEEVEDIKATTFYNDENGLLQKTDLDRSQIFTVNEDKHHTLMKFAMPNLHNGCIIEYTYRVISPYFFNFHSWQFQTDIPKVYSEYEVHIPAYYTFNASLRGMLKLTKNTAELEQACFSISGRTADCSHMVYGMADIPALIEEDYTTSPRNFLSGIRFELVEYIDFYNGSKIRYSKEWKDVDYQLKDEPSFGGQLKRKDLMKDRVTPVIAGLTNNLDKAKAIYRYLQKWYKWNEYYDYSSYDGIKKAYDTHTGSIADINLALIAALNSVGINTEAVLLSTRSHGFINKLYPVQTDFNYVVAKVNIDDKSYFLDATDPLLSFGMLPLRCLNDQGRVFSLDKPSYWIDMTGLPQKESVTYNYNLALNDKGKFVGKLTRYSNGYSAYLRRQAIKKFNSVDEYVENMGEKFPKMKITKSSVSNVDSLDNPIEETYDIELTAFNGTDHNRLSFNPLILNQVITNPFKLAERDYPVDWGMPSDERFILNMTIPDQYAIETSPQNIAYGLPNQGGKFITSFDASGNTFTLSNVLQFSKGIYAAEEYSTLKEFYNKVILAEKSDIVLKKK